MSGPTQLIHGSDYEQMRKVEHAILQAILPFQNGRTEAALVAVAMLRVARTLVEMYPAVTQAELLPVLTAFIQGRSSAPGVDDSLLVRPS